MSSIFLFRYLVKHVISICYIINRQVFTIYDEGCFCVWNSMLIFILINLLTHSIHSKVPYFDFWLELLPNHVLNLHWGTCCMSRSCCVNTSASIDGIGHKFVRINTRFNRIDRIRTCRSRLENMIDFKLSKIRNAFFLWIMIINNECSLMLHYFSDVFITAILGILKVSKFDLEKIPMKMCTQLPLI